MAQIKRPLYNEFGHDDDYKRQKTRVNEICSPLNETITCFEDLSNELIYEIYEYLDYFDVYKAFSKLNQRFSNLLTYSNLPIKINISSISKSMFKHYNKMIIKPNRHRITSFCFDNVFMNDCILSSIILKLSRFQQLQTLIVYNIEPISIENLLNNLSSLSSLTSLVISVIDSGKNKNKIYRQIFRLSTLRYCKLSLPGWESGEPLPICINEYSSIEHLIIANNIYTNELASLLSYVPQLRRLSLQALEESRNQQEKTDRNILNYLTHISLKASSLKFDSLVQFIIDFFSTVQIFYFTIQRYDTDAAYMNANKWQELITFHLTNLRIFDIRFTLSTTNRDNQLTTETQINRFTSSFWIERQWFFTHFFYQTGYSNHLVFYSINPYRRKHYILYKQTDKTSSLYEYRTSLKSVQCVHIESGQSISDCKNYFPNATEITFAKGFSVPRTSVVTILNSIIPLKQLTKLVIESSCFSVQRLIKILCHTSNIHTLELKSIPCYKQKNDYASIEESEDFQLVSNRNTIKNVTCDASCTLEQITLFVSLCRQIQYLTINRRSRNIESITRFLLDRNNPNTRHLCLLGFSRVWSNWNDRLDMMIKSEKLLNDYKLKKVGWHLYLSW